jgi:hypothetical protein
MLLKKSIDALLLILAFFVLLIPNSFQLITAALITVINFVLFLKYKKLLVKGYMLFFWIVLSAIFIFYISLSETKLQYKFEIGLKYVYFPLMWMNIFTYIKQNFSLERIAKILFGFSFASFFVVIFLYVAMLNGYNYAEYFIEAPNINSDYFLGFTLNVYGNLIFFAAGLFILPQIYKSKIVEYFYIIIFILVALISARTALLVSLMIGFTILLVHYVYLKKYKVPSTYIISMIVIVILLGYFTQTYLNYRFFDYIQESSLSKLQSLGGEERTSQTSLMVDKILNNPWGIGFSNIGLERNSERDFKYEVLILATVMRFGIFFFLIIVASLYPFYVKIANFFSLTNYQKFYMVGFFSILIFSFTNPYLESFDFQWMFFCPLIFLSDFTDEKYRWGKFVQAGEKIPAS